MTGEDADSAADTVEAYYEALEAGEPLGPFFAEDPDVAKFGLWEFLDGYDSVVTGLADQTATTEDWSVVSDDLQVAERESYAWFTDVVALSWTDADGTDHDYDTRWSGALERGGGGWRFVSMHVSTTEAL